jgi:hypothetical protein
VAVGCAIAVAACGSSAKPSSSASNGVTAGINLANCMRAYGVSNFPDISPRAGVFGQQIARAGVDVESPAFQSAMSACRQLAPAAKAATSAGFEAEKVELVKLAECMRRHGLRTFPDPTASASTARPSRVEMAYSSPAGSLSLSVPQSTTQSQAFEQAATACGFPVPGGAKRAAAG